MAVARKKKQIDKFVISTPDELAHAVQMAYEIKEQIKPELEKIEILRKGAAEYMKENDIVQVQFPSMEKHGTLVQRHTTFWDRQELLKLVKKAKPKSWKKVWQAMTTRQPDSEKIQEVLKEGLIKADVISDALVQKAQQPFVQVYDD
jgi:uncharacterized coiled-coil DUF342 family protein